MRIETDRLILRPVTTADTQAIADVVFSDPNVAGMLAHNTRRPADAFSEAARWTRIMGLDGDGGIWDDGGIGLFAVTPKESDDVVAGVAGFYMKRNTDRRWDGEYFYALGTPWHGRGLMTEAADVFGDQLKTFRDLGVIYALYWDMINEASGRLLQRTGLVPCGRKPITDEYGPDSCLQMFEDDLWRLAEATDAANRDEVALQAARRAGGFVAEKVINEGTAVQRLTEAYDHAALPAAVTNMFQAAINSPGMAYFEIRREGVTGESENRP